MPIPISNVTRRVVYAASGTGPYAFTFEVLANTDIAVYRDDTLLTLTTDYTVTIASNGTGSITLVASPTGATQIAIVGNRTIQRVTDFVTGGDFFANTVNDEMDQQTIFAQQNAEGLQRALSAPQTDPTSINMTLPRAALRANKALGFDASGNPVAADTLGTNRGNWASGTLYYVRDIIKDTTNQNIWQCIVQHTSSGSLPIGANADAFKWSKLVDAEAASDYTDAAQAFATAAATSASSAASSASTATTQATNASNSASTASTQASNASTSASTATTQATNAASSATAAAASAASAAASLDAFDDIYLGAKASNPTVDNDGNALTTGDQYFNTAVNELRVWNGTTWQTASTAGGTVTSINVTGATTLALNPTLSGGTANGVTYLNGSKVLTSGSALTFDGTNLSVGGSNSQQKLNVVVPVFATNASGGMRIGDSGNNYYVDQLITTDASANPFWDVKFASHTLSRYAYGGGNNFWAWYANNSEQMRLTSTGLGIGTSSPAYKLDVNGAINTSADLISQGNNARLSLYRSTGINYFDWASGQSLYFSTQTSAGGGGRSTLMVLDSTGNLGIGVTPSAWGSSWKTIQIGMGGSIFARTADQNRIGITANAYFDTSFKYIGTGQATSYDQDDGAHFWYTAASGTAGNAITFTQAMSLTAAGNLLVGLTTPTSAERLSIWRDNVTTNSLVANLQNQAATSTSRNSNALLRISSNASGADAAIQLTDNTANNYWFGGNNGGAYVVANSNGVRLSNGGTSWASDSDERVKDIIEPITNAANKVSTLRAVIGKYKTDDEGTRRSFLIAQDVQAVLPEAVFDENGTLMLAYTDTIPLLVAAIQELKAEFDAYKASHP